LEFRNKFVLKNTILFIATFTTFRLLLLIVYYNYFSSLSLGEILTAFLDGIRFDISTIFTFAGPLLFLLNLPVFNKKWRKIITAFLALELLAMVLLLAGDLFYFDVVKRHIGNDLFLSLNDTDFILYIVIKEYWYILLIVLILFSFYLRNQFKIINRHFEKKKIKPVKEIFIQLALILIIIIGIRGTFDDISINIIDAFHGNSDEYGNLALNGVFSVYHISRSSENISHNHFPLDSAKNKALSLIIENDELVENHNYPLTRNHNENFKSLQKNIKPNIVIILLESWTPKYIYSWSNSDYQVTPNFDSLTAAGLKFNNAYANGDRSIYGITSTLVGIPQILSLPYLGRGLELFINFRIGKILDNNGYNTIFAQTSRAGSFKIDAIADALGFSEFYAKEDFPIIYKYQTRQEPFFGWDYEGLMFFEKKISELEAPFFAYIFTGTTHEPYILADEKFEKYPHNSNGLNGFLNTLNYSDWAIGEFFKKAGTKPWFENTIFILLSDHVCKFVSKDLHERFHIPLLLYAPALIEPGINNSIVSQSDILATIFDLLNLNENYTGIGKSIIRQYNKRFVIARKGETMVYLDERGVIQHNLSSIINYHLNKNSISDSTKILSNMERDFLSIDQFLHHILINNKFYK
jgi:phosphoglycerol transferase MdoB-like AlkP superfamily enzyme